MRRTQGTHYPKTLFYQCQDSWSTQYKHQTQTWSLILLRSLNSDLDKRELRTYQFMLVQHLLVVVQSGDFILQQWDSVCGLLGVLSSHGPLEISTSSAPTLTPELYGSVAPSIWYNSCSSSQWARCPPEHLWCRIFVVFVAHLIGLRPAKKSKM